MYKGALHETVDGLFGRQGKSVSAVVGGDTGVEQSPDANIHDPSAASKDR
jgi:hypothetical protein